MIDSIILLSTAEVERFTEQGFLGPYTAVDPVTANTIEHRIESEVFSAPSRIYSDTGAVLGSLRFTRDRHLDSPLLYRLCAEPSITVRVRDLIGLDLLMWRSDFFIHVRDGGFTALHQDKTFSGALDVPCLEAADGGMPTCVSAWIALTPMSRRTATLVVVPGSHREGMIPTRPPRPGEHPIFQKGVVLDRQWPADSLLHLELQPGQFILFHNLLVHGSSACVDRTRRVAVSVRFTPSSNLVYPHGTSGHGQALDRFGSLLVSGRCIYARNVLRDPPPCTDDPIVEQRAVADL